VIVGLPGVALVAGWPLWTLAVRAVGTVAEPLDEAAVALHRPPRQAAHLDLLVIGEVPLLVTVIDLVERFVERREGAVEIAREHVVPERVETLRRLIAVRSHRAAHLAAEIPIAVRAALADAGEPHGSQRRAKRPANQFRVVRCDHTDPDGTPGANQFRADSGRSSSTTPRRSQPAHDSLSERAADLAYLTDSIQSTSHRAHLAHPTR
jgi:hypothetical protein